MLPYVVAIIELEEGPRLMSNLTDCAITDVSIGMPVVAHFEPLDDALDAVEVAAQSDVIDAGHRPNVIDVIGRIRQVGARRRMRGSPRRHSGGDG